MPGTEGWGMQPLSPVYSSLGLLLGGQHSLQQLATRWPQLALHLFRNAPIALQPPPPFLHGHHEGNFKYIKKWFWKTRINVISSVISEFMLFYEKAE